MLYSRAWWWSEECLTEERKESRLISVQLGRVLSVYSRASDAKKKNIQAHPHSLARQKQSRKQSRVHGGTWREAHPHRYPGEQGRSRSVLGVLGLAFVGTGADGERSARLYLARDWAELPFRDARAARHTSSFCRRTSHAHAQEGTRSRKLRLPTYAFRSGNLRNATRSVYSLLQSRSGRPSHSAIVALKLQALPGGSGS